MDLEYPSLHALHLGSVSFESTPQLISSFPNLRRLELSMPSGLFDVTWYCKRRVTNEFAILDSKRPWERLDVLSGPLRYIFALGLSCPVRYLDILQYGKEDGEILVDVVEDFRPQCLDVAVQLDGLPKESLQNVLSGISQSPGLSELILVFEVLDRRVDLKGSVVSDILNLHEQCSHILAV